VSTIAGTTQSYDPYKLIDEVTELLRSRGLEPQLPPEAMGEALGGVGKLLRALGIAPLMDPVDSLRISTSRVWSEEDGLQ
jgi:hypothetical protein